MERREYELMDALEGRLWWYRGLHGVLAHAIARTPAGGAVLDAGCGTGGVLAMLERTLPGRSLTGLDFDPGACAFARGKTRARIVRGSVNELPFEAGCFDAILSADVWGSVGVEPDRALAEARRCLRTGGLLVLNLPAYQWMMSAHDVRVYNARRFSRRRTAAWMQAGGFRVRRATYWNAALFPLMALRRLATKGTDAASDVALPPAPANEALAGVLALERLWLKSGLNLPFGGSLLVTAEKNG
jgi:SAM-dependent methyltransferase